MTLLAAASATLNVAFTPVGTFGGVTYHWYSLPSTGGKQNLDLTSGAYTIQGVACAKRGKYRVIVADTSGNWAEGVAYLEMTGCP